MRNKFTLLELLIMIAIIGILVSILMPSLRQAKEKAQTAVCLSNQRQVYVFSQTYRNSNDMKLPALDGDNSQSGARSSNATGQSGTVELMLYSQDKDTLPGGNWKTALFLCPADRVPQHTLNNSDERQISYHANHYPWLSGGVSSGTHLVNSYVGTSPDQISSKEDLSISEMIMYSEGDWANRGIVRNYKAEMRNDPVDWVAVLWHYRLDHAGKRKSRTLNNVYFDGHAKTLSHWLNLDAMKSTQWGAYHYK